MSVRDLLLGVFVMCLWGLNFSVIKLGVGELNPLLLTALRFTLATIPAVFLVKRPSVHIGYLAGYGMTFGIGVWGMATWSINAGLSAGMASVLLQMNVVIGLFLGWFLLKESVSRMKMVGSVLAIGGLGLSLSVTDGSVTPMGILLILLAALSWSITSIIIKKAGTKQVFAFSIWAMLFAPLPLFALSFLQYGSAPFVQLVNQWNNAAAFSVLFQAYPTTLFGYWIWNRMLVKYPLTTVAPLTLLVPVFGLLGGALFFNEDVGVVKASACLLVIVGLLIGLLSPTEFKDRFNRRPIIQKASNNKASHN
jgi:drug/metabolite transporter (DMT)-like permease